MTRSLPVAATALVLLLAACGSGGGGGGAATSGSPAAAGLAAGGTTPSTVPPAAGRSTSPAPTGTATGPRATGAASATPAPTATRGSSTTPATRPDASATARRPTPSPSPTVGSPSASGPRLSVTPTRGLDPDRATVTVRGRGYDPGIGIYVAVCTSAAPTSGSTCVGGADMSGASGSSAWISSDPPPYGVGLATPFGPGGTFSVTLTVRASGPGIDCTAERCGVVTRADHTRYGTRSQDAFVALAFD